MGRAVHLQLLIADGIGLPAYAVEAAGRRMFEGFHIGQKRRNAGSSALKRRIEAISAFIDLAAGVESCQNASLANTFPKFAKNIIIGIFLARLLIVILFCLIALHSQCWQSKVDKRGSTAPRPDSPSCNSAVPLS